ncbi:ParB/RepB/Spo0J family partition protein [Vibrio sonorensis]|uniref:ParB/RepB/Spo0J family partition protein n=1 Tax=Vibrio sonorensis TaxID=1004316 RepID=UPI0008D9D315|nr:ParB/RepB/Spo0J family partition protein [Vibrio sonorensis]
MAKKGTSQGIALSGISEASMKEAVELANMRVGQTYMMPIGDEMAEFELVRVAHHDIEKKTHVLPENARIQEALNAISLNDILPSIEERGMQDPAKGYIDPTGKIEVWNGSRRRKACILAKRDYFILVTKKEIKPELKRFISDIANQYKPFSLYERGAIWSAMLEDGTYPDAKQLAEGEQVSEAVVTTARKAFGLPRQLVNIMPSINDLGRPAINEFYKRTKALKEGRLEDALESLESVHLDALIEEFGSKDGRVLNNGLLSKLYELLPKPAVKLKKKKSDIDDQTAIVPVAIPEGLNKVTMVDSGKQKAYIVEEGNENNKTALIELSGIPNAALEDIYNYVSNKLEGNQEQIIDHEDSPSESYQ